MSLLLNSISTVNDHLWMSPYKWDVKKASNEDGSSRLYSYVYKQEAHRPEWSPEYQRLYTDFLSEGLIFAYQ